MIKNQKGASLPITILIMSALILSATFLMRATETSTQVSSDIGEKIIVSNSNEWVAAQAYSWLIANQANLNSDISSSGYYSSFPENGIALNTESAWQGAVTLTNSIGNNKSQYLIYRMCSQSNAAFNSINNGIANKCATSFAEGTDNSMGFGGVAFQGATQVFFKIYARSVGVKSSQTISEATVGLSQ